MPLKFSSPSFPRELLGIDEVGGCSALGQTLLQCTAALQGAVGAGNILQYTAVLQGAGAGVHLKGRGLRGGPRGGYAGGWRGLPKRLGAVTVGYECH